MLIQSQKAYNRGQKSWDTFAFPGLACEQALLFGRVKGVSRERASPNRRACSQAIPGPFPIITGPTPPLTPQTTLEACIHVFQHCIRWGWEYCKKISKRMHCFMREPRMVEKSEYALLSQGLLSMVGSVVA